MRVQRTRGRDERQLRWARARVSAGSVGGVRQSRVACSRAHQGMRGRHGGRSTLRVTPRAATRSTASQSRPRWLISGARQSVHLPRPLSTTPPRTPHARLHPGASTLPSVSSLNLGSPVPCPLQTHFWAVRDYLSPVLKDSKFKESGRITPDEFVAAGDFLAYKFPTWQWEAGDPNRARDFLPTDKQYLVSRNGALPPSSPSRSPPPSPADPHAPTRTHAREPSPLPATRLPARPAGRRRTR